jgi:acetylglutamate kinase
LIEVTPLKKEMGFVGKPKKIKIKIIKNILKKNYIPIIASLGFKGKKIFNINADTVAGELASSLSATRFYFITNIKGVMDKNNKLIKEISPKKAKELIKKKNIQYCKSMPISIGGNLTWVKHWVCPLLCVAHQKWTT